MTLFEMFGSKSTLLCFNILFIFSACGIDHPVTTSFSGPTNVPIVDSGGSAWSDESSSSPSTGNPGASSTNPNHSSGSFASTPNSPNPAPEDLIHNTKYCQVDSKGNIISSDSIQVTPGDRIHGLGGGCISRPIRKVWAVTLNHSLIKADDIDEYVPTSRPDLVDLQKKIYFVFDIANKVNVLFGLIPITWNIRWYHSIPFGTYSRPNQIAINFMKTSGTDKIEWDQEGYVLDRVTENVTSFVMQQTIKAPRVDVNRVNQNIADILEKMRSGDPNWSALPDNYPRAR